VLQFRASWVIVEKDAAASFASYLGITEKGLKSGGAIIVPSLADVKDLASHEGALVITAQKGRVPSHFRKVAVSDEVLAINPSVTALFGNRSIGSLSQQQAEDIAASRYTSWQQLGGPDLPLHVLASGSGAYAVAAAKGSACLMSAKAYQQAIDRGLKLSLMKIQHKVTGLNLTWEYITSKTEESGKFGGILSIIINTVFMVILTTLFAAPLGVAAAVYLAKYAKRGKLTQIIRAGIDLLAGVPSIIFGLFGLLVFVQLLGWSFSLISGVLTLVLMILPTIVRTSEEAIKSVNPSLENASRGLGATKIETIWKITLPSAANGITTGVILAIGRAVGETAALIFTIGSSTDVATGLDSSARVLAQHIYLTITEGQSIDHAFASALVLIVLVLFINTSARMLMQRGNKKK
jgi:phosphate transport system permease protein